MSSISNPRLGGNGRCADNGKPDSANRFKGAAAKGGVSRQGKGRAAKSKTNGRPKSNGESPTEQRQKKRKGRSANRQVPIYSGDPEEVPFVHVPLWVIKTIGANTAAIILARMVYWLTLINDGRRTRLSPTPKDNRSWAPGYKEITRQTGLTKYQIMGGLKTLLTRKRIEEVPSDEETSGSRRRVIRFRERFYLWLRDGRRLDNRRKWPGVKVRATEIVVTDSIPQALVLSNILRWFQPNEKGESQLTVWDPEDQGGHGWRYCSYSQLAGETALSFWQAKRALKRLREKGLIITTTRSRKSPSGEILRILHVRPDFDALARIYRERTYA
jgi:hypothetical protein